MDFFEALRQKAGRQIIKAHGTKIRADCDVGVEATIEALKEMMVAEPVSCEALSMTIDSVGFYTLESGTEIGWLLCEGKEFKDDGEEVVVMVFRDG